MYAELKRVGSLAQAFGVQANVVMGWDARVVDELLAVHESLRVGDG